MKVYSNWSRDAEAVDDMMSSGIGKVVAVVVDVVEGEVGMTLRCGGMGVKLVVSTGATYNLLVVSAIAQRFMKCSRTECGKDVRAPQILRSFYSP